MNSSMVTIGCLGVSLLSLIVLHFLSSEFDPKWRMISEYALGKYKHLLTVFFFFWGLSTVIMIFSFWDLQSDLWWRLGWSLMIPSSIGTIMGGLFDIKHKLHGVSFLLGVPTFIIGSLVISYQIITLESWSNYSTALLTTAHLTWISSIIMGVAMGVMFSGFKKANVEVGPDQTPPEHLPPGVIGLGGYANRLLVLSFFSWTFVISYIQLAIG
ncbi:MAG: DUF998 domain-containing protein [Marinoscillum sp.]